jgi:hypothetical protein
MGIFSGFTHILVGRFMDEPDVPPPAVTPVASPAQPAAPGANNPATPTAQHDIAKNGPFMS